MLQVSAAGSVGVAGGAGVAAGGSVVVVVVVSVEAVSAGSFAGVHAISATPARIRSDAFFMAKESSAGPTCGKLGAA
jgi:hypothetical protein